MPEAEVWGMSPCSEKERAKGGWARQAEASVLQDNIGPDIKTGFFLYLSKDLDLFLCLVGLSVYFQIKTSNIRTQYELLEITHHWFNWRRWSSFLAIWDSHDSEVVFKEQPFKHRVCSALYTDVTQCFECLMALDKCVFPFMTSCPTFWSIRVTSV